MGARLAAVVVDVAEAGTDHRLKGHTMKSHPLKVVMRAVALDGSTVTDDSDHVEITMLPSTVVDDIIFDIHVILDDSIDTRDPRKRLVLAVDRDQFVDALIKADLISDSARALLFKKKVPHGL